MGLVKEFKEFAMKGNVVDLAVGVVIGGAFGKIVSSLVADIIMPVIGRIVGSIKFTDIRIPIGTGPEETLADGSKKATELYINIGNFMQVAFDFLIVAAAIFAVIKLMNTAKAKMESKATQAPPAPPAPPEDVVLLREIRDALKARS